LAPLATRNKRAAALTRAPVLEASRCVPVCSIAIRRGGESLVLWPAELDRLEVSCANLVVAEFGLTGEGERASHLHLDLVPFAESYLSDEALGGISGERDRFDVVEGDPQVASAELSGQSELAAGIDPFGVDLRAVAVDKGPL